MPSCEPGLPGRLRPQVWREDGGELFRTLKARAQAFMDQLAEAACTPHARRAPRVRRAHRPRCQRRPRP